MKPDFWVLRNVVTEGRKLGPGYLVSWSLMRTVTRSLMPGSPR